MMAAEGDNRRDSDSACDPSLLVSKGARRSRPASTRSSSVGLDCGRQHIAEDGRSAHMVGGGGLLLCDAPRSRACIQRACMRAFTLPHQSAHQSAFTFSPIGTQQLKTLSEPTRVFSVLAQTGGAPPPYKNILPSKSHIEKFLFL